MLMITNKNMYYFNNKFECFDNVIKHAERVAEIASKMKTMCFVLVMSQIINDVCKQYIVS